ncbi:hypothetical protein D3C71_1942330 [compost metagenome]
MPIIAQDHPNPAHVDARAVTPVAIAVFALTLAGIRATRVALVRAVALRVLVSMRVSFAIARVGKQWGGTGDQCYGGEGR